MRIAVFDYRVTRVNPVGSCHLRLLSGLCHEHEFTVFAVEFENPCPERIRWVRIPAPLRPYLLLYAVFHIAAPIVYAFQLARGVRFDLVQMVESNLLFGDLSYAHFCHRRYLKDHWRETRAGGLRGLLRGAAHWLAARLEPLVYRRVRQVVVPSQGLRNEVSQEYAGAASKIRLLPNAVDVERFEPPADQRRQALRGSMDIGAGRVVLLFVALGHFERKGLPLILEALRRVDSPSLLLLVVGGERGLVDAYRARVRRIGLADRVRFEGMQRDLARYYWAADAFVFPSCYEVFPLVTLEAAAAALPLLVTPLNGVEEMLRDRQNGLLLDRTAEGVADGIRKLLSLTEEERRSMGDDARRTVRRYNSENFVAAWRGLYERMA